MEKKKRTYLNLQVRGLNTFQSDLSEVPVGALQVADNFVIDKEGILETRRGIRDRLTVPSVVPEAVPTIKSFHPFNDKLLLHVGSFEEDFDGNISNIHYLYETDANFNVINVLQGNISPPEFNGEIKSAGFRSCLLYTSPSPRDRQKSRMPSSA